MHLTGDTARSVCAAAEECRADLVVIASQDRRPVVAGGLAILSGVCAALGITELTTSTSALRDGLIYDILGRIRHEDSRERAVRGPSTR